MTEEMKISPATATPAEEYPSLNHLRVMILLWDRAQLLFELQARIDAKDRSWKGGPYERYVLVIHTDEFSLDRETVARFLQGATFQTHILTDVFLGLSFGTDPIFRLHLLPRA